MTDVKFFTHESHPAKVAEGKRVRLVYDEMYRTRGSYGYDTEEETKEAEDYEIDMLDRGNWVVLGRIEEEQCKHCSAWSQTDSLWGMVVDNSDSGFEEAAFDI